MHRRILVLMTIGAFVGTLALVGGLTNQTTAANSPLLLAQSTPPPETNSPPSGTLTFTGGSVALGIGYTWGNGTLDFQGAQRPFSVSGLSVVNVGVTNITASGQVFNLKKIEDFNGVYTAATAGGTLAGGGSIAYLRNQNGVFMKITSTTQGLSLQLSADGVKFTLQ
jgi:hypothetical protein